MHVPSVQCTFMVGGKIHVMSPYKAFFLSEDVTTVKCDYFMFLLNCKFWGSKMLNENLGRRGGWGHLGLEI